MRHRHPPASRARRGHAGTTWALPRTTCEREKSGPSGRHEARTTRKLCVVACGNAGIVSEPRRGGAKGTPDGYSGGLEEHGEHSGAHGSRSSRLGGEEPVRYGSEGASRRWAVSAERLRIVLLRCGHEAVPLHLSYVPTHRSVPLLMRTGSPSPQLGPLIRQATRSARFVAAHPCPWVRGASTGAKREHGRVLSGRGIEENKRRQTGLSAFAPNRLDG